MIESYKTTINFEDLENLNKTENYNQILECVDENNNKIKVNIILRRIERKRKIKNSNKYHIDYENCEILLFDTNKRFFSNSKSYNKFESMYDYEKKQIKIFDIRFEKKYMYDYEDEDNSDGEYIVIKINKPFIELNEFTSELNLKYLEELIAEEKDENKLNKLVEQKKNYFQIISKLNFFNN